MHAERPLVTVSTPHGTHAHVVGRCGQLSISTSPNRDVARHTQTHTPTHKHTHSAGWLRSRHPVLSPTAPPPSSQGPLLSAAALTPLLENTHPQPSPPPAQSARDPGRRRLFRWGKKCACAEGSHVRAPNQCSAFARTPFPRSLSGRRALI